MDKTDKIILAAFLAVMIPVTAMLFFALWLYVKLVLG